MRKLVAMSVAAAALTAVQGPVLAQSAGAPASTHAATHASGPAPTPAAAPAETSGVLMPIRTHRLENGLRVVFHVDRSDPVAAVVLAAHVGSASETPGRTGFAHLFEHLFFLNSENLGPGGLDAMSARIGGSGANGSTSRDLTDYLQTVPNDALEKMIWAEADKLGFFINTVTEPVLAKEKQVVKNEKRQSYDNQPYGHTHPVIVQALYPADHPYSWPVIGSLADLDAATLEDVQDFYRRWYTPDNATLVVAGDFDPDQALAWVETYLGEIPAGPGVETPQPRPAVLARTVRLMHEDNFANLPELTLVWPGVELGHRDAAALDVLTTLLTDGKAAPLNAVVIDERKLAPAVSASSQNARIAGEIYLRVRAFDGADLDAVKAALDEGFARFEREGVDPEALRRVKTMAEAGFYARLDSVLGKGSALARYDAFGGSADEDLARLQAVTAEDVMRVYRTYVAGRPHVATSFVPKGRTDLALEGSAVARVVEEPIVQGAEAPVDPNAAQAATARTPSRIDRSVEPPAGPAPVVATPTIWNAALPNGLAVSGIQHDELPLVSFTLSMDGGRLLDDPAKPGAANLLARMMDRGTARRTPVELENAFKALGATISVSAGDETLAISGRTLARNLAPTLALVEEMLLEPRWDETELALAKSAVTARIQAERVQPAAIASRVMSIATYGPDHVLAGSIAGSEQSVAALTMDDLKTYMAANLSPASARFRVVGDIDQAATVQALQGLGARWTGRPVSLPPVQARPVEASRVYFHDVPGAAQSVLLFGGPSLTRAHPDAYPVVAMNYVLGGGGFASRLTQQLREGHGYTYGVSTSFQRNRGFGAFALFSNVRSNVTLEAAALGRDIMRDYGATFTEADLELTRGALTRSRARSFETTQAKLGVLAAIGDYGLPADYLDQEARVLDQLSLEQVRALAERYIDTDRMIYVVVGDAATQEARLEGLGYGAPVRVNDWTAPAAR